MSKVIALYTDRVAPGLTFDLPECVNTPVELAGFFTRRSNGFGQKMTKPRRGHYFDPQDEDTELFWVLKIDGVQDLVVQNVSSLNGMLGFTSCIAIEGEKATFRDGAVITVSGTEIQFSIQA